MRRGWFNDGWKHALAARGVKTKSYYAQRTTLFGSYFQESAKKRSQRVAQGTNLPRFQQEVAGRSTGLYTEEEVERLNARVRKGDITITSAERDKLRRSEDFLESAEAQRRQSELRSSRPSVAKKLEERAEDRRMRQQLGLRVEPIVKKDAAAQGVDLVGTKTSVNLSTGVSPERAKSMLKRKIEELSAERQVASEQHGSTTQLDADLRRYKDALKATETDRPVVRMHEEQK